MAQSIAIEFKPNPVMDILNSASIADSILADVSSPNGQKIPIINDQMFEPKQSSEMNINGFAVGLKCESINSKDVVVSFNGRTNRLVMH